MAAPWTDPTQNGEDIVYWLLAREGRSANDANAITLAAQAITDAQLWIWRQWNWWWARVSSSFDTVASTQDYVLTTVNSSAMQDLGKVLSVRVDGDGPMTPMTRSEFERTFEDDLSGALSAGSRYLIEYDPPTIRFERTPSAVQTVIVDYSILPGRYRGSENILIPAPFQDLLRYVARWYFRDDDDARGPLEADPFVTGRIAEMKGYGVSDETPPGIMKKAGRKRVLAGIFPIDPTDWLDKDGVAIN